MTADSEALARGNAPGVDTPWPSLQKNLARARRVPTSRMRSWTQHTLLRLALLWLSVAIAWAGVRTASDLTLRRWMR